MIWLERPDCAGRAISALGAGSGFGRCQPIGAEFPLLGEGLARVATCGYTRRMISTGIRDLKNNLSSYVRQIEAGKRIAVTAHGRVVAELVPPSSGTGLVGARRYDELLAAGVIEAAAEPKSLPPEWPDIRLAPGTAAELIDSDRGEA